MSLPRGLHQYAFVLSVLTLAVLLPAPACAGTARHALDVQLHPEAKSLFVHDEIVIDDAHPGDLVLLIAAQARITSVSIGGVPPEFLFQSGRLSIPVGSVPENGRLAVDISYEAEFSDPLPQESAPADNPGYGVTGTITEKGSFFLPDSGWYPQLPQYGSTFRISVSAPRGIYAVTAGRLVGHEDRDSSTVSTWEVADIGQGLALSAARYVVRSVMAGKIPVYTYFFPETDSLSQTYLDAAASHLAFYESLHGPYPFPKFAVVENFFPTGYGFPSYTLMGTSVLQLPFIPQTSLRHEIAHSWWGNGVLVDYDAGNWCEGLTTYVADYLSQELVSASDAKQYRQQVLLDYSALVPPSADFPLTAFTGRTSAATRAVGYGKAAFVFHMIRQRIGNEPFWHALQAVFSERLFVKTSWEDLRRIFVRGGKWDDGESRVFFDQWVRRSGAPYLELRDVRARREARGWQIEGSLSQNAPAYGLHATLRLRTASTLSDTSITANDRNTSFSLAAAQAPEELGVDPDIDIFRRLSPGEIPVTVNSVKGAKTLVAVLANGAPSGSEDVFKILLEGLNHPEAAILREDRVDSRKLQDRDFIFFGFPHSAKLKPLLAGKPESVELSEGKFAVSDVVSSAEADCIFVAFEGAGQQGRLAAVFLPLPGTDIKDISSAARKITHYGKYSYLAYLRGVNKAKGVWTASHSPLRHVFGKN